MKHLSFFAWMILMAGLLSCGSDNSKEETRAADTTVAKPAPPETKPAFSPVKVAAIVVNVKNFDKWKANYFADDSLRKVYGMSHLTLGRDLKDSNKIYVLDKIDDMDKARSFAKSSSLKEAGPASSAKGTLAFSYGEMIRLDDAPVESDLRLGVAHHVRDFGKWVKFFDGEGPATRASYGVVDRSMSRDLVDSNMVYLTFAITDTAKAMARMKSPDFKKLTDSAGVDSAPTVRWYRIVK